MTKTENQVYRFINAVMRILLRSPLHFFASGSVILLLFSGRKSGRRYDIPIGYIQHEQLLIGLTHRQWSHWWQNFSGGVEGEVMLKGKRRAARLHAYTGSDARLTSQNIAYLQTYFQKYKATAKRYQVTLDPHGIPSHNDCVKALQRPDLIMIVITLDARTGQLFDGLGTADQSDQTSGMLLVVMM